MIGDIFVQSWLIWATFNTTGEHFFHQKFSLLSSDLKKFLAKDFPMQPFANVLQITCYCKFLDNQKKYLFWGLFLIHVLIKLLDWWPATLLEKRPQHQCFSVNVWNFLWNTFGDCFWGWFWKISKGGLTWNDLYDLTNLNIAKLWPLSALKCRWYDS